MGLGAKCRENVLQAVKNGVLGGVIVPGWGHFLPGNKKPQLRG